MGETAKLRNEVNSLWKSFKERQAKSREIIKYRDTSDSSKRGIPLGILEDEQSQILIHKRRHASNTDND
jgi:hypothetical protein